MGPFDNCPEIGTEAAIPGPPGPQGDPGPPGPKGDPGENAMNLWANVAGDGTLQSGTAAAASRGVEGFYFVTFDRDVSGCSPVASVGLTEGIGPTQPDAVANTFTSSTLFPNEVRVATYVKGEGQKDSSFHLIVAC